MRSERHSSTVHAGMYESMVEEARRDGIRQYGVSAIISNGEKVLLVRRRKDDFLGGIYEFPGGIIEVGEGMTDALIREVREETGLTVCEIGKYIGSFDYDSEDGQRRRVFNFHVKIQRPLRIQLKEHDHYVWADETKLAGLELTEPILRVLELFRVEKIQSIQRNGD